MKLDYVVGTRHSAVFVSESERLIEILKEEFDRSFCTTEMEVKEKHFDGRRQEARLKIMADDSEIKMAVFKARIRWFAECVRKRCNMAKAIEIWKEVKAF